MLLNDKNKLQIATILNTTLGDVYDNYGELLQQMFNDNTPLSEIIKYHESVIVTLEFINSCEIRDWLEISYWENIFAGVRYHNKPTTVI